MKKIIRQAFAFMLTLCLLAGALPVVSLAADNELVLTKIGHKSTDTVTIFNPDTRSVTLTVPFLYAGDTVNLAENLIVEKASAIARVNTDFFSGAAATVGGPGTAMTVTYYKGLDTTPHTTIYNINIIRAAKKSPAFSGTIVKTFTGLMPNGAVADILFTAADFTSLYNAFDGGALTNISISGSSLDCGSLKLKNGVAYDAYSSGDLISLSDIGNLVFDAAGGGFVSYIVRAYDDSVPVTAIGSVFLDITVNAITAPTINGTNNTVSKAVNIGSDATFTLPDFSSLCNLNHGTLDSVQITPASTEFGTWYNGSAALTGTATFTSLTIGNLRFRGSASGTAAFTWKVSNEAGFSAPGNGTVTVSSVSVPTIISSIDKDVAIGATLAFSLNDFKTCYNLQNGTLSEIVIRPTNSTYGKWYKGNSQFTGSTSFTASTIGTLKFVGSVAGQAAFTWTVANEKGASSWGDGTVTVNAGTSTTAYSTAVNTAKAFSASDFNTACNNATGTGLSHVRFTLPSASYGTLYYNYSPSSGSNTAVQHSTYYFYNKSPNLSNITFVPANGYLGTVTISYTGYDTNSIAYAGSVKIIVGGSSDINYVTTQNTAKTFKSADFNNACTIATGSALTSVKFALPSSVYGKLYYNYTSSTNPGSAVSASTSYYPSSSPNISNVTFVPAVNFTGSVTLTYTGYSSSGSSYTGNIRVSVGAAGDITYHTPQNTPTMLKAPDFDAACISMTGDDLSYVRFTLPSTSYGRLYYGYTSPSDPGTSVKATTSYYESLAPFIDYITFVPASNYSGTVVIAYTGYNTDGVSYTGYVNISIGTEGTVIYTTAVNAPVVFSDTGFDSACTNETGSALSYVKFTLPSTSQGRLYYDYSSPSSPGSAVKATTVYNVGKSPYIKNLTFVPAEDYKGTVNITYTGYSTEGTAYIGYVRILVGTDGVVNYETVMNTPKNFSASEFNTACVSATGSALSYVKFTLPSSSNGKLYYDYTSSSVPGAAVNAATAYHTAKSPYLDEVTFVPAAHFKGSVTIRYTGYTASGAFYSGSLVVTVTGAASDIALTTNKNKPVTFKPADFNTVCSNATGAALDRISLTLPSVAFGKLYYNYNLVSKTGTVVSSGGTYYMDGTPRVGSVTFVPAADYTGSVTISYKGYNIYGVSFTGKIVIQVNNKVGSSYFTDVGSAYDWAVGAIDYLYDIGVVTGTGSNKYNPSVSISRGEFMVMIYRAMKFTASTGSNFSDVPKGSYYYNAIAAAKALGIAEGYDGKFNPDSPITRQDAMVLIHRALVLTGISVPAGSNNDIAAFTDKGSIAGYAVTAVQALVKAGLIKGTDSKLNPFSSLSRAEMAVVVYREEITF